MTNSIGNWLENAGNSRHPKTIIPGLDYQLLCAHVTRRTRSWVIAHPDYEFTQPEETVLISLLERYFSGEPLPYLLGHWEFFGLDFYVSPSVLIPRPETELLVEAALDWLGNNPNRRFAADVGTGSACIAVSLAHMVKDLKVVAVDISSAALSIAMRNIFHHRLGSQIFPIQGDLLSAVPGIFDLVCANLPYIPSAKLGSLPVARFEPFIALDGGSDGLDVICRLLHSLKDMMAAGGLILLEIEVGHGISAPELAQTIFSSSSFDLRCDLSGNPRLLSIQL